MIKVAKYFIKYKIFTSFYNNWLLSLGRSVVRLVKRINTLVSVAAVAFGFATLASAENTSLRIQTHFTAESMSGKMVADFIENVGTMSNDEIKIKMFYGSAITKATETFDAAIAGILDCDMTDGSYQASRDPAFQFASDLVGLYLTPQEQMAWLIHGNGYEDLNVLYNAHDMEFIGWWIPGPASFSSSKSVGGIADVKDWRFRSSSGLSNTVFTNLGTSPIVINSNAIPGAIVTGILDDTYAATLTETSELALYDIRNSTNFPGFYSMPTSHLACRKGVWDSMPSNHQAILKNGMQALALKNNTMTKIKKALTTKTLLENEVYFYKWTEEELYRYRSTVKSSLVEFATTAAAKTLIKSHVSFLTDLNLLE